MTSGGPVRVGDDARQQCAQLFDVQIRALQPTQARFAARGDGGQRLVDLVGDGRGEFAEHGDARCMCEVAAHAFELQARRDLLGNVDQSDEHDPLRAHLRRADDEHDRVAFGSIQGPQPRFTLEAGRTPEGGRQAIADQPLPARIPESRDRAEQLVRILGPIQLHRGLVRFDDHQCVHRRANELRMRGEIVVDAGDAALAQAREHLLELRRIDPEERHRHAMEDVPVHELRVLERRARKIALRDVHDADRHECAVSVLRIEMHRELRVELDALRGAQYGFPQEILFARDGRHDAFCEHRRGRFRPELLRRAQQIALSTGTEQFDRVFVRGDRARDKHHLADDLGMRQQMAFQIGDAGFAERTHHGADVGEVDLQERGRRRLEQIGVAACRVGPHPRRLAFRIDRHGAGKPTGAAIA